MTYNFMWMITCVLKIQDIINMVYILLCLILVKIMCMIFEILIFVLILRCWKISKFQMISNILNEFLGFSSLSVILYFWGVLGCILARSTLPPYHFLGVLRGSALVCQVTNVTFLAPRCSNVYSNTDCIDLRVAFLMPTQVAQHQTRS